MFKLAKAKLILVKIPGWLWCICNNLLVPPWPGKDTSGKLTAESVEPLSEYLANLLATSKPMFSCASLVLPPMCGVKITLSNARNGVTNSSSLLFGSTGNTSIAAPDNFLLSSAWAKASISTTVPREALIKIAPSFMLANSLAPIMFLVCGFSGTCKLITSHSCNSASKEDAWLALPRGNLVSTS